MSLTPRSGRVRRSLAAGAALVAGALALVGCAAGTSPDSTRTGDGTLRIAVTSYPSSWDQDFVAFDPVALELYKNIYPYMVDYGTKSVSGGDIFDTQKIVPTYAQSFDSTDGQTWTLTIKPHAKFANGDPITAEDVKWSKDRAFAANANVAGIYKLIGLTSPDQVSVVDDHTVVFHQAWASALSAQIQAISLFVYDAKVMKAHATASDPWAQSWAAKNPSDGGYYTVASATPGQEIVLKKNPNYLGGNPSKIDEIDLTVVSDSAAAETLLQSGDVDMAEGLSATEVADLAGQAGVKIISAPSNTMISLPLNTASGPFASPALRQAVAYALPYKQIISTVYGGQARQPKSLVPIDMPGYSSTGFPYTQDLTKAKALVAKSGESGATVGLGYAAGDDSAKQIAVIVQQALAQIGITVTPEALDPASLSQHRQAKDLDMQIASGQQWVNDVEYLANNTLVTDAYLNYANYSNATVDDLVTQARSVTDETKREALWLQLQRQLATDVPAIPLAQPNFRLAVRDDVGGFVMPIDGLIRYNTLTLG